MKLLLKSICILAVLFTAQSAMSQEKVPYVNSMELFYKGYELFNNGKYNEAIEKYEKVNRNDSLYTGVLTEKTNALYMDEQYREAIDACKEGISRESMFNYTFYSNMAKCYSKLGQYDSALLVLDLLEKEYPDVYLTNYDRVNVYLLNKKTAQAADLLIKVINFNPFFAAPHYDLAKICLRSGRYTQGLMCVALYLSLDNSSKKAMELISYTEKALTKDLSGDSAISKLVMKEDADYSDIDELIESGVATNRAYKSKLASIDYPFVKQLQLISEKISTKPAGTALWQTLYQNIFTQLHQKNIYEGLGYAILVGINNNAIAAGYNSNKGKVNQYVALAISVLDQFRDNKPYKNFGLSDYHFYDNGELASWGKATNGKKNGLWIYFHTNGRISKMGQYQNDKEEGEWRTNYNDGTPEEIVNYKKGKYSGFCQAFYPNGNLKLSFTSIKEKIEGEFKMYNYAGVLASSKIFIKGKLNGLATEYDGDGNKIEEFTYVKDKEEGVYKTWYNSGQLKEEAFFIKGMANGRTTNYHPNGKIKQEGDMIKGKRSGLWKSYYSDGTLYSNESYINGLNEGEAFENDADGKLYRKFYYNNGIYSKVEYFSNDKLWLVYDYKDGRLQSIKSLSEGGETLSSDKLEITILKFHVKYPNGNSYITGQFLHDELDGVWNYYHENGALKESVKYANSLRNGSCTAYYQNGKIFEKSNYVNDQLAGYFMQYHKNGEVLTEGWYDNGQKDGQWYAYTPNGTINYTYFMNDGVQIGFEEFYDCDNRLNKSYYYDEGLITKAFSYDTSETLIYTSKLNNYSGVLEVRNPWGKQQRTTSYSHGRAEGKSQWYYSDGTLNIDGQYHFNEEHGAWNYFDEKGKAMRSGTMNLGMKVGTWREYIDGKLSDITKYIDDEEDSISVTYQNEKPTMIVNIKHGKRHGKTINIGPDGQVSLIRYYRDGYLIGYSSGGKEGEVAAMIPIKNETAKIVAYYTNGQKSCEFELINGYFEGKRTVYYLNGNVYTETEFEADEFMGAHKEYYPNGNLKSVHQYVCDQLDGNQQFYAENGKLERIESWENALKNGAWKYYDSKGKVVKSDFYHMGLKMPK